MATEKKPKKAASQQIVDASQELSKQTAQAGQQLGAAIESSAQQQAEQIASAEQQRQQALSEAQQQFKTAFDSGAKDLADIALQRRQAAQQAEEEARAQVEADRKAARWTGATEMAASIINLIGTAHGASPQQYHTFSQDWMKKADEDLERGRSRVHNLNERAEAARSALNQLRMGEAKDALELARKEADAIYGTRVASIQNNAKAALEAEKARIGAGTDATTIKAKGVEQQANLDLKRQELATRNAQNQQAREDRLALRGLKLDENGKPVPDTDSEIYKALVQKNSGGSGGSINHVYYRDENGKLVYAPMKSKEYEIFIDKVYAKAMSDPDFAEAYEGASSNYERKSLLFNYASSDPELRAELDDRRGVASSESKANNGTGFFTKAVNKANEVVASVAEEDKRYNEFE